MQQPCSARPRPGNCHEGPDENEGVISNAGGREAVRVIRTDEEIMIARTVCRVLGPGSEEEA